MDGVAVKVTIILARAESSILFWNEEEWSSLWGFGRYNVPSLQVFNESLAGFPFGRIKKVNLRNLWNKGVFEFNGMIEGSMRWKDVIRLFREDIGEISAETRDWDFLWFLSLSKLC